MISKDKDDEENPLWSAETQIYVQAEREYSTQIRLKELIDTNPKNAVISWKLLKISKETEEKQKNVIITVLPDRTEKSMQVPINEL